MTAFSPANHIPFSGRYLLAVAAFTAVALSPAAPARSAGAPSAAPGRLSIVHLHAAGSDSLIPAWQIQSSSVAGVDGARISSPGYVPQGWWAAPSRSTVLGALVDDGKYSFDPFYSENLRKVDARDFAVPWWFRADFTLDGNSGLHTYLRTNGVIPRADVWINGVEVATHKTIAGAFNVQELDITGVVRPGTNTVALLIYPADPMRDLTIGWIDWNQWPPDNNMGLWRGVDLLQSGAVSLSGPRVQTSLHLPDLSSADLTVKAEVTNHATGSVSATVDGAIVPEGPGNRITFSQSVTLAPGETRTVDFTPDGFPQLHLDRPNVWWPAQLGAQPLYHLSMAVTADGALSDAGDATFGIRDVQSELTPNGKHRLFLINGKPLLIRGGGWAPDIFLRYDPVRIEQSMRYALDLGLNAIRLEGKLENDVFYQMADRYGILVLPGWECCDKWEAWAHTGGKAWTPDDYVVAGQSMASEAQLLRNHPSVIAFLIGSDNAPPDPIARMYLTALQGNDWPDPVISSASADGNGVTGPSGMKMAGPYDWEPPDYWYDQRFGGAAGFATEISAGNMIPTLDDLQKFMSPADLANLWQEPNAPQFHASPNKMHSPFVTLAYFDRAMAQRLGKPTSLQDYVEKAQLLNYETNRAQFEAYERNAVAADPATGVIYWMFDNAWPSLHWHLFDSYFEPAGAYFGAKKAGEPLHVQWSYDDRSVVAVNETGSDVSGLSVGARMYDLAGRLIFNRTEDDVSVPALGVSRAFAVPEPKGLSGVYFVELTLSTASGASVSRNVYWLSTVPDRLDWSRTMWWYTPQSKWADLSGLSSLPSIVPSISGTSSLDGSTVTTRVTLTNPGGNPNVAFFMGLKIRAGPGGAEAEPITWSDNYVSLWPGESVTVSATYPVSELRGAVPEVDVSGWNVADQQVSAPIQ